MKKVHGVARALSNGALPDVPVGDYEPKSILLTGGAGFIASHVVIRLVNKYPDTKVELRCPSELQQMFQEWSNMGGAGQEDLMPAGTNGHMEEMWTSKAHC